MIFKRKLVKVIKNSIDVDLASTEYKISVYEEISTYLSDNNCVEGMNLVNKRKNKMDDYVNNIKRDLSELGKLCRDLETLVKDSYKEKKSISSILTINDREIYVCNIEKSYYFIYSIGYEEYLKLYKYGIIEVERINGRACRIESEIGFSHEKNLDKYNDFKIYFNEQVTKLNNVKYLNDLEILRDKINTDLSGIFYTKDLREYLAFKSEEVYRLTGISGIDILRTLRESYDIKRVKIKLLLNNYSIENDKFIEAVIAELSCKKIQENLNDPDLMEDEKLKPILTKALERDRDRINLLLNEINMGLDELEIAVSKVDSEID